MRAPASTADVCLILEGTYPYVTGGVSTWTHDLIVAQKDLTFHLVTLLPVGASLKAQYELPRNVLHHSTIFVQHLPAGKGDDRRTRALWGTIQEPLLALQSQGGIEPLAQILEILRPFRSRAGAQLLLNSPAAWDLLLRMYEKTHSGSSFLDYFWSSRALLGGLYSVLLADLPDARVYHTVSTGYAGLLAARAALETGRPVLLTEHGIYTNERRIEIGMADWLQGQQSANFDLDHHKSTLKDLWINTFVGYSRACYAVARKIVTLYEGNQQFQLQDGAAPEKLAIIPNGIDYERFSKIGRAAERRRPTVALIGRVVPIKDIKTFIRACSILKGPVPDIQALILGPTDEDPVYFQECQSLVRHLGLDDIVTFTGRVQPDEYLGRIDVVALTSISEAQPLTILEAGAAGIPTVATDVGACREMILGRATESPALGPGGAVTPLCNPVSTATAIAGLLNDSEWYGQCSRAIRKRVLACYDKQLVDRTYLELYETYRRQESETLLAAGVN
ncbi:MAG TPA: GT4 family glycosyltransferase PelF [Terriglobia bacterium]|nr:GT4 family glycosyltransferase PelF [Terriglobia bacterium]